MVLDRWMDKRSYSRELKSFFFGWIKILLGGVYGETRNRERGNIIDECCKNSLRKHKDILKKRSYSYWKNINHTIY
jgi:hypothetical protein